MEWDGGSIELKIERTEAEAIVDRPFPSPPHQPVLRDADQQGGVSHDRAGAAARNTAVLRSQVKRCAMHPLPPSLAYRRLSL